MAAGAAAPQSAGSTTRSHRFDALLAVGDWNALSNSKPKPGSAARSGEFDAPAVQGATANQSAANVASAAQQPRISSF
jgi:hypothetical protein